MIIVNSQPLTAEQIFWYLYLEAMESPTKMLSFFSSAEANKELLQSIAARIFWSLDKRGVNPVYAFGDGSASNPCPNSTTTLKGSFYPT